MRTGVSRLVALSLLTGAVALSAQQLQPTVQPGAASFELTSVKRNISGDGRSSTSNAQPNGGWRAINVRLRAVIARAYEMREFQITGGPDWIHSDRFDIVAHGPEGTPASQRFAMLRAMLADRFKLVTHIETREQPLYVLTLARPDGRFGPQLKRSTLACSGQTTPQPGSDCGVNASTDNRFGTMSAKGVPMDNIAAALANFAVNRTVVNRTGLEGWFDAELRFATEGAALAVANRSDDASSIFTAVQEQLGLRLQSDRGPVPFVVIDSVQEPTPD
jgi:uncharacterized protein (TIGR03435 family)